MQTSLTDAIHIPHGSRSTWIWTWGSICGGIVFLALMVLGQPLYPAPWFDEGLNVNTAATLANKGVYGLSDNAGVRVLDPAIQTGPTIIVPIALVYRVFGSNIIYARLTILAFAFLALVTYGLLAKQLLGEHAMALAVLLLLLGNRQPFASFTFVSRQVLGEVPALAYVLLGFVIWLPLLNDRTHIWRRLILSGLAWGIAMVTKSQILLLLPICLAVLTLLNQYYYRVTGWLAFVVPGIVGLACVASWYGTQFWMVGPEQFQQNAMVLHDGFTVHVAGLSPAHWRNALNVLLHSLWWLWGAPGLAWGVWQARRRTVQGFRHALVLMLPLIGLIWFSLLSIGWDRYAFYTFALTPIWVAGLLTSLWQSSSKPSSISRRQAFVAVCIMGYIIGNGWTLAHQMMQYQDNGYVKMQDYVATHVPPAALIETWEWELSPGVMQPMHHPSTMVANIVTEAIWSDQLVPDRYYDPLSYRPDYLIQGPFSAWTKIYRDVIAHKADLIASFGDYTLYRVHAQ